MWSKQREAKDTEEIFILNSQNYLTTPWLNESSTLRLMQTKLAYGVAS